MLPTTCNIFADNNKYIQALNDTKQDCVLPEFSINDYYIAI